MSFLISVGNLITCMLGLKCIEKANIHSTGADKIFSRDILRKRKIKCGDNLVRKSRFSQIIETRMERPASLQFQNSTV